jgi:hypothetical protein
MYSRGSSAFRDTDVYGRSSGSTVSHKRLVQPSVRETAHEALYDVPSSHREAPPVTDLRDRSGFYGPPAKRVPVAHGEEDAAGLSSSARYRPSRPLRRVTGSGPGGMTSLSHDGDGIIGEQLPSASTVTPRGFGGYPNVQERELVQGGKGPEPERHRPVGGPVTLSLGEFDGVYTTSVQEAQRRMALEPAMADLARAVVPAGSRIPERSRAIRESNTMRQTMELDDGSGSHPSKFRHSLGGQQLEAACLEEAKHMTWAQRYAGTSPGRHGERGLRVSGPVGGMASFRTEDLGPLGGQDPSGHEYRRPTTAEFASSSYCEMTASKLRKDERLGGKSADLLLRVDERSRPAPSLMSPLKKPQPVGGVGPLWAQRDLVAGDVRPLSARIPPGGHSSIHIA